MRNDNLKKFLFFHADKPEEKAAYQMIDKVRYYQTAFITKLVNDFFSKYGLSANSGYDSIQKVVKEYLAGTLPDETNSEHAQASSNNIPASSNDALLLLAQMQSAIMQQLNMQQMTMANMQQLNPNGFCNPMMVNTGQTVQPFIPEPNSPDIKNPSEELDPLPSGPEPAEAKNTESTPTPIASSEIYEEDDEEDMDEDLTALAAGFQNMLH